MRTHNVKEKPLRVFEWASVTDTEGETRNLRKWVLATSVDCCPVWRYTLPPRTGQGRYSSGEGSLVSFQDIWMSKPDNLTLFLYDPTPLITSYSSLPLTDPARITISGPLQCVGGALEI